MVKSFGKSRFWSKFCKNLFSFFFKFSKILILVKIIGIPRFWWKFREPRFWYEFGENLDFDQNFVKILIFVKILSNLYFGQNYRKISILVKKNENLAFGMNFRKIWILVWIFGKSRFWSKFWKISISGKFSEKLIWSKVSKNLELIKSLQKSWFFFFKILYNLDFGQNYWKISILVKISKPSDNLDFCMNFRKNLGFSQNFRKISILVNILDNLDCGQNCRKISILVKKFRKSRFW